MSVWDDPALKVGGEFVKLENPGETVSGVVTVVRPHRFDDGSVAPQILLTTDDGEERTLTAGQVRLKTALAEQRPEAGDWIKVTLTQLEPRSGGKTLKHFEVQVVRANQLAGNTPAAAPVPPAAPAAAAPAAPAAPAQPAQPGAPAGLSPEQQAAINALTPEQRRQLGLPG